jgi:hypothetical protein
MWIFTTIGYFSVTADQDSRVPRLQVRARVRKDLDLLRSSFLPELSPTIELKNRDYPYRGYCSHEEWAGALVQLSLSLNYSNFKNEVTRTQGRARHDLYSRVWGVMNNAEATLRGMDKTEREWTTRSQQGWFNPNASTTAKHAYDKKHRTQLMLDTPVKANVGLYPKDAQDPFEQESPNVPDVGASPDGSFDLDLLSAQLKELQALPRRRPRPERKTPSKKGA